MSSKWLCCEHGSSVFQVIQLGLYALKTYMLFHKMKGKMRVTAHSNYLFCLDVKRLDRINNFRVLSLSFYPSFYEITYIVDGEI